MWPHLLLWVSAGTLLAIGVLMLTGRGPLRFAPVRPRWWHRAPRRLWIRAAVGLMAGLAVLVATRWVAAGVGVAAAVIAWPAMFGSATIQRAHIARLEALAAWVEALRDTIATSRGLPEALPAAAARASAPLAGPMRDLAARFEAREPVEPSLRQLADDLNDPIADQVIATLLLNVRAEGKALRLVLSSLAASTRKEVETRRTVEAERQSTRRGTAIIMAATVVFTLLLTFIYPQYQETFTAPQGQLMLAIAVGFFAAGFAVMHWLSAYTTPDRFLTGQPVGGGPR